MKIRKGQEEINWICLIFIQRVLLSRGETISLVVLLLIIEIEWRDR